MVKSREDAIFIFQVENVRKVEKILQDNDVPIVQENELYLI